MGKKPERTTMTLNLPLDRARQALSGVFEGDCRVEFHPAPAGRGTEVTLYGGLRASYGELRETLRRAKQRAETGEIATGEHAAHAEALK